MPLKSKKGVLKYEDLTTYDEKLIFKKYEIIVKSKEKIAKLSEKEKLKIYKYCQSKYLYNPNFRASALKLVEA